MTGKATVIDRLDERAVKRVQGAAWDALRGTIFETSRILLSVSPDATSELTTIYVKFMASKTTVYAVAWVKSSKELVIGLSLPDGAESPSLMTAPTGMTYKGLTKYLRLLPGDAIP